MAGYGVFCAKSFQVGDFLLEYRGSYWMLKEGRKFSQSLRLCTFLIAQLSAAKLCGKITYLSTS